MNCPVQHDAASGEFSMLLEGQRSLLQYRVGDGVMAIVHTEVPARLTGRGIAAALVEAALDFARSQGWRVRPACSYAAAFLRRHPEYADLLA